MASGLEKATSGMEDIHIGDKIGRHCGFCLILVFGGNIKLCSKCKRRAYCSKECQKADWKSVTETPTFNGVIWGHGQGHKNWCGLEVGEEDLDWKVAPISGKGLGLVALRDLPPLYRILVEGMQPMPVGGTRHPEMDNLAPANDPSLYRKFEINCVNSDSGAKIGLRLSRANHSCESNASYTDEEDFNVFILYSNREILAGEEICFAYARFNDLCKLFLNGWVGRSPNEIRNVLTLKWDIVCPSHCPCLDLEKLEMMTLCKKLDSESQQCFLNNKKALKNQEKIIEMAKKLGCSQSILCLLYWWGCEYAVVKRDTLPKAREYLEKCLAFRSAVYHPKNKGMVKMTQGLIKDLSKTKGYLSAEF